MNRISAIWLAESRPANKSPPCYLKKKSGPARIASSILHIYIYLYIYIPGQLTPASPLRKRNFLSPFSVKQSQAFSAFPFPCLRLFFISPVMNHPGWSHGLPSSASYPPCSLSKIGLKVQNQASFFVVFILAKKPVGCTPAIRSLNCDGHNT